MLIGLVKKGAVSNTQYELTDVNGWPSLIARVGDKTALVLSIETDGQRIFAVHMVLNPEKLARV
jgi:hypothetical protein